MVHAEQQGGERLDLVAIAGRRAAHRLDADGEAVVRIGKGLRDRAGTRAQRRSRGLEIRVSGARRPTDFSHHKVRLRRIADVGNDGGREASGTQMSARSNTSGPRSRVGRHPRW